MIYTTDYRWAGGWNQPLSNLVQVDPQPKSEGLKYPRRLYTVNLAVLQEGTPSVEWVFKVAKYSFFETFIGTFFFSSQPGVVTANASIKQRLDIRTYKYYNVRIIYPELDRDITRDRGRWSDFRVRMFIVAEYTPGV